MRTKIRCILLDDELPGLAYLKMMCEQLPELEIVKAYDHPQSFMEDIGKLDFDLCFLDIEMGELNGMQIANLLRDKLVIFVTAYKEYAVEAFELNAVDYVCKPLQYDRLRKAVDKVVDRLKTDTQKPEKRVVQLNSDRGKVLLSFDQIDYITISEQDSRDKRVFLLDGQELILKNISFDRLLALLPSDTFCRINKKEILALRIIRYYTADEIIATMNGKNESRRFTLSDSYRSDFVEKIEHCL